MEEIQHLQRRLHEQVLERAEADPQWRHQYLDDPETAIEGIPEARQLREMLESPSPAQGPPEATMPATAREESRQLQRSLMQKMLDKAASDPLWKQRLLDDTKAAIQEANFPETQQLAEMRQQEEAETLGHFLSPSGNVQLWPTVVCETLLNETKCWESIICPAGSASARR